MKSQIPLFFIFIFTIFCSFLAGCITTTEQGTWFDRHELQIRVTLQGKSEQGARIYRVDLTRRDFPAGSLESVNSTMDMLLLDTAPLMGIKRIHSETYRQYSGADNGCLQKKPQTFGVALGGTIRTWPQNPDFVQLQFIYFALAPSGEFYTAPQDLRTNSIDLHFDRLVRLNEDVTIQWQTLPAKK